MSSIVKAFTSKPKAPPTPAPPPPAPKVEDPAIQKAAEEERLRTQQRKGLAANILTSPMGVMDNGVGQGGLGTRALLGR